MEDKKENKYVDKVANIVVTVVAACIVCVAIALTVKFVGWLIF